jgi:DNA-binding CsgD family transcriptional regulator/PAS domain-containing protein
LSAGTSVAVHESLTHAIGAIYDAAVAPDRWPEALRHLRETFATESTAYVVHDTDRTKIDRVAAETDPEGQKANVEVLLRSSIAYRQGAKGYAGQIIRVAELVPDEIFHRSPMYQNYWRPRALYHGLRLTVAVDGIGTHHIINLLRPKSGSAFEEADIALARTLMPRLQQAIELRRRLREVDMLASAALTALEVLPQSILLLDRNGRVLHANSSGRSLLREADGLGARNGILFAATQTSTNQLHAVFARAAGLDGLPVRAGALRLPSRSGGAGMLALLAIPFRQETHWSLPQRPEILVCVADPGALTTLPGKQLAELFGLTGAEAALATELLAGQELREIAKVRGRSINTVRTQLARLMAKTNVDRQSDLMRLLARLPGLRETI